ncbi:LysR family transcriptional regulator [Vineibacter terrae]|uniref:LysR family transcriptional regulator n=1 Tax=Vineibacter terrae TaxID=2586908 RepID=UPI002E34F609|nr:LysR family transcriptional regulator [Vineibacter terrae]HEX2888650.1 LysR family transcriptional regulator [Vineibacter terrae]
MDLRQLRYFVAIAERGSFSAAASALNVAQSALSRHIKALEQEMGGLLFERGRHGIAISESGKILLDRARYMLGEIDNIRAEVSLENREPGGTVRLAAPSTLADILFAPLAQHVARRFPRVRVQFSEGLTEELCGRVLRGALDLALVTTPQRNEHLDYVELFTEGVHLIGAPDDPRMRARSFTPGAVATLPLILPLSEVGRELLPERPACAFRVDNMIPLKQMVMAGLGYGFLPYSGIHQELAAGTLAAVEIPWIRARRVLALPRGRPTSRATREMVAAIKAVSATLIANGRIRCVTSRAIPSRKR